MFTFQQLSLLLKSHPLSGKTLWSSESQSSFIGRKEVYLFEAVEQENVGKAVCSQPNGFRNLNNRGD